MKERFIEGKEIKKEGCDMGNKSECNTKQKFLEFILGRDCDKSEWRHLKWSQHSIVHWHVNAHDNS